MKIIRTYKEGIASLQLDGLPDQSLGHDSDTLGILLSWKLNLIGLSVLEGKKDHLLSLAYVILTYSRYCISGLTQSISDETDSVTISRNLLGHELMLMSSKKDIKPLRIILDDAELSDLTRCLDKVIDDNSLAISWSLPSNGTYSCNKYYKKLFDFKTIANQITGIGCFVFSAFLFLTLFIPYSLEPPQEKTVERTTYPLGANK